MKLSLFYHIRLILIRLLGELFIMNLMFPYTDKSNPDLKYINNMYNNINIFLVVFELKVSYYNTDHSYIY